MKNYIRYFWMFLILIRNLLINPGELRIISISDLESFTKLPQSARGKIENLFKKASRNLSHASDLKKALDEWGVYKEYEDRFLDLFKKKRLDH